MSCPHCSSLKTARRSRRTRHGYKTYHCNNCKRIFNERTATPFNRSRLPTTTLFKVVLWRLRYKLSPSDLAEMFGVEVEGFYFTRETIRQWQDKFAPLLTDELKKERVSQADKRWKVDETLLKVGGKFHYLYRATPSKGKLVESQLSPLGSSQSTSNFLQLCVNTVGYPPEQLTSDKEASYPGAIQKVLGQKVKHRTGRCLNNRLEQDHRAIKGRYTVMACFKKLDSAALFCQAFDDVRNFFKYRRWHKDHRSSQWKRADFKAKF